MARRFILIIMTVVAALAILGWGMPLAASHLVTGAECQSRASFLAQVLTEYSPGIHLIGYYQNDDAREFINIYNELPPVTDHVVDEVLAYEHPAYVGVLLIFVHSDCLVGAYQLDRSTWNKIDAGVTHSRGVAVDHVT